MTDRLLCISALKYACPERRKVFIWPWPRGTGNTLEPCSQSQCETPRKWAPCTPRIPAVGRTEDSATQWAQRNAKQMLQASTSYPSPFSAIHEQASCLWALLHLKGRVRLQPQRSVEKVFCSREPVEYFVKIPLGIDDEMQPWCGCFVTVLNEIVLVMWPVCCYLVQHLHHEFSLLPDL